MSYGIPLNYLPMFENYCCAGYDGIAFSLLVDNSALEESNHGTGVPIDSMT
jgi:hypothetical protein